MTSFACGRLLVASSLLLVVLGWLEPRLAGQGAGGSQPADRSAHSIARRIAPRPESQWSAEDRALAAEYTPESSSNAFKTFLNHPGFVRGVMPFFNYLSAQPSVPARQ